MLPTSTQKRWGEFDERTIVKLQARRAACKSSRDSCPRDHARDDPLRCWRTRGLLVPSSRHLLGRDSVKIQIGLPRVGNGSRAAVRRNARMLQHCLSKQTLYP
jgi:hypothetical protein